MDHISLPTGLAALPAPAHARIIPAKVARTLQKAPSPDISTREFTGLFGVPAIVNSPPVTGYVTSRDIATIDLTLAAAGARLVEAMVRGRVR